MRTSFKRNFFSCGMVACQELLVSNYSNCTKKSSWSERPFTCDCLKVKEWNQKSKKNTLPEVSIQPRISKMSEYIIQLPTAGSKTYFSSHPLKEWHFSDYFFSEHKKLKHFNRIVSEYTADINRIIAQEGVPSQVKHFCRFLLQSIVSRLFF